MNQPRKSKVGRKSRAIGQKCIVLGISVTPDELREFGAIAQLKGINKSELFRLMFEEWKKVNIPKV